MSTAGKSRTAKAIVFALLAVLTLSFLYPLFFMLENSLKTRTEYFASPFTLPRQGLQVTNYFSMISQFHIFNLFKNSLIVSTLTVVFLLFVGILAGHVFARLRFKGKNAIYVAVLATMFIPSQVTIIPLYVFFSKMGLVNMYAPVVLSYLALFLPEAILFMTASFRSILNELYEAAEIDGCSYSKQIWHVTIPMGKPAISLSVIFYFIMSWNDLFTPMILLQSMEKRTVMVALASLMGRYSGSPTLQFAGLLLSAIPALLVYVIFQKNIIKGISMGALK